MNDPERAAWRMDAMCDALGVHVAPSSPEHADMAARCAHCEKGEACRLWRLEAAGVRDAPPGYCLNAERIARLAAED